MELLLRPGMAFSERRAKAERSGADSIDPHPESIEPTTGVTGGERGGCAPCLSAQFCKGAIIGDVTDSWTDEESFEDEVEEPPAHPPWRRRTIMIIGAVVAVAMLAGPVWNIFDRATPEVSDSGLELCGFDYCVVQDSVRQAGHDLTMSRLTNTFLEEAEAQAMADDLVAYLGVDGVTVEVVDRIDRRIAGQYDPSSRHILLERPARAWIVVHEVAHTVALGHGDDFQQAIIDLAAWVEAGAG